MMLGPAMDMSAPESGSTCRSADPLQVEISAWMVGAQWVPARDVLMEGVVWTALMAGSCVWGWAGLQDLQTLAKWLARWHRWHTSW